MPNVKARHIKALTDTSAILEWVRQGCPVKLRNKPGQYWLKVPMLPGLPRTSLMVMNHNPYEPVEGVVIAAGHIQETEISLVQTSNVILPHELFR